MDLFGLLTQTYRCCVRKNPFSPDNYPGTTPLPQQMRKEIGASWGFASTVNVERSTVEQLKDLLDAISSTFREHGMFDLAAQADDVAALL